MTLNCEKFLQQISNRASFYKTLQTTIKHGLIIIKKLNNNEIYYILDNKKNKLLLLNLNKLPIFEQNFILTFATQSNNPKDIYFLNFLKRNVVKNAIQYHDCQKIKNFYVIPQNH